MPRGKSWANTSRLHNSTVLRLFVDTQREKRKQKWQGTLACHFSQIALAAADFRIELAFAVETVARTLIADWMHVTQALFHMPSPPFTFTSPRPLRAKLFVGEFSSCTLAYLTEVHCSRSPTHTSLEQHDTKMYSRDFAVEPMGA